MEFQIQKRDVIQVALLHRLTVYDADGDGIYEARGTVGEVEVTLRSDILSLSHADYDQDQDGQC